MPVTQAYGFCAPPKVTLDYIGPNDREPSFFLADNCLIYRLEPSSSKSAQEKRIAYLTARGFQASTDGQGRRIWKRLLKVGGKAYRAPQTPPQSGHVFETSIPMEITHSTAVRKSTAPAGNALRTAATPFAIAADLVPTVVMIPLAPIILPFVSEP